MEHSSHLNLVIDVLMLAGTILLQSGAEVHRVEDTMLRIAHSQGIDHANVLAFPAALFFSIDHTTISRIKRILNPSHDMQKVCQVNQISRSLADGDLPLEEALRQLIQIQNQPLPYSPIHITLAAIVAAPCFTLMFGGSYWDAVITLLATSLAFPCSLMSERHVRIGFVSTFTGALVFSLISLICTRYTSLPLHPTMIHAGAVMPFVPGIAFTNAFRDLMTNHLTTGLTTLFQTLLILLSLGAGTALAFAIIGGA